MQDLWHKPQAEAVFSLEQHTGLCPEDELHSTQLAPWEELFLDVLWS